MQRIDVLRRFNVTVTGEGEPTLVLAHGFGSDQTAWRHQVAALGGAHRIVLFDHLGCGRADVGEYNPRHYTSFERYAEDIVQIYEALDLRDTVFVGHSVSAMIGMLASFACPGRFARLVFVAASPRYLDDEGYIGGFTQANLDAMYAVMADSYLGWANGFGSLAMGNPEQPELGLEFARSLAAMRPDIAQSIARMIFESDLRAQLSRLSLPTLILQTLDDPIVPMPVADYLAAHVPQSQLALLRASGHLPHLSAPDDVTAALRTFVAP